MSEPTYANQLIEARRLLDTQGREALRNPHAMIGRECGCGGCFCCAALETLDGRHAVTAAGRSRNFAAMNASIFNPNGPGFKGLYAGDVVEFAHPVFKHGITAAVLPLLVFSDHVQVRYGPCGYTVDDTNYVRLVRRGKRHMQACKTEEAHRIAARVGVAVSDVLENFSYWKKVTRYE